MGLNCVDLLVLGFFFPVVDPHQKLVDSFDEELLIQRSFLDGGLTISYRWIFDYSKVVQGSVVFLSMSDQKT